MRFDLSYSSLFGWTGHLIINIFIIVKDSLKTVSKPNYLGLIILIYNELSISKQLHKSKN